MSDKYASDFPLPGGVEQYFDTLIGLLRRVAMQPMSHEQLEDVVLAVCPNTSRSKAIGMYLGNVSRMGLWGANDGVFRLTPEGHTLLETAETDPDAARRRVLNIKLRDVLGYPELLQRLADGPADFETVDSDLKQRLQVSWTSRNQTSFRLGWLRSLGYVRKHDNQTFGLTESGRALLPSLPPSTPMPPPAPVTDAERKTAEPPIAPDSLIARATLVLEQVDKTSTLGGTGMEFEQATAAALSLLGFDVECIGGAGNPDIIATAVMGLHSYRVLIETKSRAQGTVTQNDVNFLAVKEHRQKSAADYVVVFAKDFAGGNLVKWAEEGIVRLVTVAELQEVVLAHAESVIPLDRLRDLFEGHGKTRDDVLAALLAESASSSQRVAMCRDVYEAIHAQQNQEAALNEHSLYFILKGAYSIQAIRETTEFLRSGLIAAVERTPEGSLYCRLSPRTFAERLDQIRWGIGGKSSVGPEQ